LFRAVIIYFPGNYYAKVVWLYRKTTFRCIITCVRYLQKFHFRYLNFHNIVGTICIICLTIHIAIFIVNKLSKLFCKCYQNCSVNCNIIYVFAVFTRMYFVHKRNISYSLAVDLCFFCTVVFVCVYQVLLNETFFFTFYYLRKEWLFSQSNLRALGPLSLCISLCDLHVLLGIWSFYSADKLASYWWFSA
jgi:hypothetical protein